MSKGRGGAQSLSHAIRLAKRLDRIQRRLQNWPKPSPPPQKSGLLLQLRAFLIPGRIHPRVKGVTMTGAGGVTGEREREKRAIMKVNRNKIQKIIIITGLGISSIRKQQQQQHPHTPTPTHTRAHTYTDHTHPRQGHPYPALLQTHYPTRQPANRSTKNSIPNLSLLVLLHAQPAFRH